MYSKMASYRQAALGIVLFLPDYNVNFSVLNKVGISLDHVRLQSKTSLPCLMLCCAHILRTGKNQAPVSAAKQQHGSKIFFFL